MYLVIHNSEDGLSVSTYDKKKELLEAITPDEDGSNDFGTDLGFMIEMSQELDPIYWPSDKMLIIKGEVIVPIVMNVITKLYVD